MIILVSARPTVLGLDGNSFTWFEEQELTVGGFQGNAKETSIAFTGSIFVCGYIYISYNTLVDIILRRRGDHRYRVLP